MNFKELRQGLPVFMLVKSDEMKYTQGKVVNIGTPRFPQLGSMPAANPTQMVIDVTVEADGQTVTHALPTDVSATAIGTMLITTDKQDILRELKATEADCEDYLANYDKRKKKLERTKELIGEIDTSYKEKQEMEGRMAKIEGEQKAQGEKLDEILALLKGNKTA